MKKKIYLILAFIILISIPAIMEISGFYIVNKPINSKNLLIEGWLEKQDLENPPFNYEDFDSIFVVGLKNQTQWNLVNRTREMNYVDRAYQKSWMLTDGFLFLKNYNDKIQNDSIKSIRIIAHGTPGNNQNAHFFLSVKDSVLGNAFVKEEEDTFEFQVNLQKDQLEYLNIYFDNDYSNELEDINLKVAQVDVDDASFWAINDDFFFMNSMDFDLISSSAKRTANQISTFIKKDIKIFTIDTVYFKRNKTLVTAYCFNNFLKKKIIKISSLNLYTLDYHSRRTKLAYTKALPENVDLGIFAKRTLKYDGPSKFISWYKIALGHFVSWFGTLISFH